MNSNSFIILVALTLTALPTLAQNEIQNNQPVTRKLGQIELRIQTKLKVDFQKGLIDSDQLSAMQRDFDAIMVKEDDFKTRGFTDKRRATINKLLKEFETKLDQASGVSTINQAEAKTGVRATENNAGVVEPTK